MTSSGHPDIGPELRALAQAVLDRLDPAVRAAAAMATESLRGPGRCQQVWCPVCALAALVSGEQHPMLTVIAEHSVTLMAVIRAMVADAPVSADAPEPPAAGAASPTGPNGAGDAPEIPSTNGTRYQHIPIVIETITGDD